MSTPNARDVSVKLSHREEQVNFTRCVVCGAQDGDLLECRLCIHSVCGAHYRFDPAPEDIVAYIQGGLRSGWNYICPDCHAYHLRGTADWAIYLVNGQPAHGVRPVFVPSWDYLPRPRNHSKHLLATVRMAERSLLPMCSGDVMHAALVATRQPDLAVWYPRVTFEIDGDGSPSHWDRHHTAVQLAMMQHNPQRILLHFNLDTDWEGNPATAGVDKADRCYVLPEKFFKVAWPMDFRGRHGEMRRTERIFTDVFITATGGFGYLLHVRGLQGLKGLENLMARTDGNILICLTGDSYSPAIVGAFFSILTMVWYSDDFYSLHRRGAGHPMDRILAAMSAIDLGRHTGIIVGRFGRGTEDFEEAFTYTWQDPLTRPLGVLPPVQCATCGRSRSWDLTQNTVVERLESGDRSTWEGPTKSTWVVFTCRCGSTHEAQADRRFEPIGDVVCGSRWLCRHELARVQPTFVNILGARA